ncbi:MAG: rod shape-determining protein MreC [Steroidobacteraceae bacterium]
MAVLGGGSNRSHSGRDSSPGFRFTLYAILSVVVMYYDQRDSWLTSLRYYLSAAAYPVQVAVSSPQALYSWGTESFQSRKSLRAENDALRVRERELSLNQMRFAALEVENARLRALRNALPPVAERSLVAEVVSVELNPLRQRLLINKGERDGAVFRRQAVVDARGLLGQVVRVGPWSAEIILITDPEHAVPVEIVRNGLRSIAVGAGNSGELLLPYLAVNSDIKPGDLLVTSGLGGVFPAGYPVAKVTGIKRDPVLLLAQVRAQPLATLERDREVMLLWFAQNHPASPSRDDQKTGLPANPNDVLRVLTPAAAEAAAANPRKAQPDKDPE